MSRVHRSVARASYATTWVIITIFRANCLNYISELVSLELHKFSRGQKGGFSGQKISIFSTLFYVEESGEKIYTFCHLNCHQMVSTSTKSGNKRIQAATTENNFCFQLCISHTDGITTHLAKWKVPKQERNLLFPHDLYSTNETDIYLFNKSWIGRILVFLCAQMKFQIHFQLPNIQQCARV